MATKTIKKETKTTTEKKVTPKVSKTWLAMLKNKNTPGIEIVDMRAVLK